MNFIYCSRISILFVKGDFAMSTCSVLTHCNLQTVNCGGFDTDWAASGPRNDCISPVDDSTIASVRTINVSEMESIISRCYSAFQTWRCVPAPIRGRIVKELAREFEIAKESLADLITLEMGKCRREALGEVQEMIDALDFATGLSRQLAGPTLPSERSRHRIQEQWHPLGMTAVITAFNFPAAVWSWNAALALVCGDTVLWKPSSKTPLTAIACIKIADRVLRRHGQSSAVCSLAIGSGRLIGDALTDDPRVALVSFTGSVARGREVGVKVQRRFGRHILELGGNNAVIVSDKADLDIALRSIYFGAIGTAGQRCTSTRRIILHEAIHDSFLHRLKSAFESTRIGDPRSDETMMGPLVDVNAVDEMMNAIAKIRQQGGRILTGGDRLPELGSCYVTPCLAEVDTLLPIVREETFAPILYVMRFKNLEEAIRLQNDVSQGLSSAIITNDMRESELFLSLQGSDCGIANVNCGTSGAEIGGAFGGEKETGGGRECGSDSWKAYMRRQTSTINFSGEVQLAQGIRFRF